MLAAVVYGVWYWQSAGTEGGGSTAFAERACRDAITSRFDLTNVSVFDVTENRNGYTVRASGTRANGTTARLVCLTSANGTVRDVTVQHR